MFKLESYITPVILSYVEKYVKNFKPEQSQVSLWGGDASFQNLDLRLEVLEEQLNLPFTFVSGHIHELLIHVPWVKITSEPIIVTINTIECILKLKDENNSDNSSLFLTKKQIEIPQEEAPPGYIKSIVTKVINNITINCNNLILKYVEEDIVLSINVRFLSMQTVNNKWEPAFTDVSNYEVKLQKIITIQDLTLCLDKMDTSGKIEIYQDPVLYRCSMTIRLIMSYHSNTAKRASITRLDLHCQKMEFSVTEQQIPMILRLVALLTLLQSRPLSTTKEKCIASIEENEAVSKDELIQANSTRDLSWGMWAWNTMSSVLPVDWDNEWSTDQLVYAGHVIHFGLYIDDATITFKTVESVKEQLFYKSRKIKYKSFLTLRFSEAVVDAILQGISMTNFTVGCGSIRLYPRGTCSCGYLEVIDGVQPPLYLTAGKNKIEYLKGTLFDSDTIENQGKRRVYKKDISYHLASFSVPILLERCPAFCMDYVHYIEIPDDITPEQLDEFGSNYEYSNFREERHIRYGIGNLTIRLCSGLFHRIETIKKAADKYDYSPYNAPKPEPSFDELPPVTVEEYEALRENIPMMKIYLYVVRSAIQLQLSDHRITGLPRQRKYVESRTMPLVPALSDDPFLSIECDTISGTLEQPLYSFRLIACASKQTEIPPEMLDQCYRDIKVQMQGISSQVYLKTNCRTSIIMPCNIEYNLHMLLYPMYWKDLNTIHNLHDLKVDAMTITGTKAKIMVASSIIASLLYPEDLMNPLLCSSLYTDSCNEKCPIYIEIGLETVTHKGVMSMTTTSFIVNICAVKVFAHNESQQAFILSGPEMEDQSTIENQILVTTLLQFSKDPSKQKHPALLSFQVAPMKGCLDPLLLQWLDYHVTYYKLNTTHSMKTDTVQVFTDSTISDSGYKKRTFRSLHESVHSSSDKDKRKFDEPIEKIMKKSVHKLNESEKHFMSDSVQEKNSMLGRLVDLYPWWSGLVLNASVGHIIIYIPTTRISGIGVEGIEQAKEEALRTNNDLQILVIKTPIIRIHSGKIQPDYLPIHLQDLPITLPEKIWLNQTHNFPWTLEILNFECFTLKGSLQRNFIKKVCLKATFDLTDKNCTSELIKNKLSALSLCVYIDTSPIIISVSEEQVVFLNDLFNNIVNIIQTISPQKANSSNTCMKEIKEISFAAPHSSSSPTQLLYLEDTTTTSALSAIKENAEQDKNNLNMTACIQWTITKIALKLYIVGEHEHATLKLVLELEDIITSIDMQSVYFKLKHKITTATIFHYTRDLRAQHWDFGDYVGLLLSGREDNFEKNEDSGFLNLILTIAKSGNVYTRWGARKLYKIEKKDLRAEALKSVDPYITEVVVKIQMMDVIVPPSVLAKYIQIIKPFINKRSFQRDLPVYEKKVSPSFTFITNLRNERLPLIYLEFKGFRLLLPVASKSNQEFQHDLLMFQVDGVRITPQAENPICRVPFRSDIYQLAAQANILHVPGSSVEDRQYQINVDGICAHTTTWKDYQQSVAKRVSQSYLYTMNENPAVEWNKLGNGSSLEPHFSTLPMITRFDFCFIIAPVIIFKPDTMVCASAAEINCLTDLELILSLNQIKLVSSLYVQFMSLFSSVNSVVVDVFETPRSSKQTLQGIYSKSNFSVKQIIIESDTDFTKDSGVDFEIASISSTNIEKPLIQEASTLSPFEFLINCGKITITIYDVTKAMNSEYETNAIFTGEDDVNNIKQPLLHAMINQPNFYFSQHNFDQKMQISCFDVTICTSNKSNESSTSIPTESDFKMYLIETKNGELHPDTGIPPSVLIIKYDILIGKTSQLNVNMGRPTKFHFSLSHWKDLIYIKNKLSECFAYEDSLNLPSKCNSQISTCIHSSTVETLTSTVSRKYNAPDITVLTKQFVISFKSDAESELLFSLASLSATVTNVVRPERIYGNVNLESLIISIVHNSKMMALLSPCCCNATVCLLWESWQTNADTPQIQIQAESDSVYLDFGPKHILIVSEILSDYSAILEEFTAAEPLPLDEEEPHAFMNQEQHYKDDLKSGAFQFVDGNAEELPFPYQVVFFSYPQQAMAWRYPHPRALTNIHVSPMPFETYNMGEKLENRVPCGIEYWSETQMTYQRYVDLYLSETESYRLDLPDKRPLQVVACIWRIVLLPMPNHEVGTFLSSKALIACLRVDSYFNPRIVPKMQAAVNIRSIHLSFYNHVETNYYNTLPPPLSNYKLNVMVPEAQCFALLEYKQANFLFHKWSDNALLLDLSGRISFRILDYGLLILQEVSDSVKIKGQLSICETIDSSLTCDSFCIKICPSTFHTLTLAAHLWNNSLDRQSHRTIVLTTRYVIANDSNIPIRFGQSGTDDSILLESRQCNFYSWRHANNQVLRVAVEENGLFWSKPFPVNVDGAYEVDFNNSSLDMAISINIVSLSASQKLVTFSGHLIISNQLVDSFEMKLVKYDLVESNKSLVTRNNFHIPANSQPPSIVITDNTNMAMRLRFCSIANLSWTGDIPLQPNARWGQPWLVKIPLQERGHFISSWVRIILEQINGKNKILAIISPLYMIRSYLPVPAKVQIETPSLKVSLNTVINGRGEKQQLYCPGTFEHFHQLTFQIESGVSASNPYVPLSYSSVDQRKFFKRFGKESIQDILTSLESIKEESKWPFQTNDFYPWVAAEQPQTHVQVKYEDAGLASSTLLLELQPWCFILNSLGSQLSIVSQDVELCRIPHYGIVAPPKLEGTFHIGVSIADEFFMSSALQLIRPDWSQGFYKPKVQGLIPLEGNIKSCVDCCSSICMMNINSSMYKDMRVVRISSNYVIGNMTDCEFYVATLAVPNSSIDLCLPNDLTSQSFSLLPSTDKRYAVPIVQWYTLFEKNCESFALYILLQLPNKSWSCPVRVDQSLSRRCVAVSNDHSTIPVVITTQEDKSTVYIMIHIDKHPQLYIENKSSYKIIIGQANKDSDNILPDSQHFKWNCQIQNNSSFYYSMPIPGSRLPDVPNNSNGSTSMLITATPSSSDDLDNDILYWSESIDLPSTSMERVVQIPDCENIKLIMRIRGYTTYIHFILASEMVVSNQELRKKLENKVHHQGETDLITNNLPDSVGEEQIFRTSSSTSTLTFFSTHDEILDTDSLVSSVLQQKFVLNNKNGANKMHIKNTYLSTVQEDKIKKLKNSSVTIHLQEVSIVIMKDINQNAQRIEVTSLCMIDTILILDCKGSLSNLSMHTGDLQLDNRMIEQGGFDFPVVLISQKPFIQKYSTICFSNSLKKNVKNIIENSLLTIDLSWESFLEDKACKDLAIKIAPISVYIEGTYVTLLMDYVTSIIPACFVFSPLSTKKQIDLFMSTNNIYIPDYILVDAKIISHPLRLHNFVIEPVTILLSVHTSVHLYVAFDHSPLYFEAFERKNLMTTTYRLGNALAMHYLSGAIFGVGWVVGSLEILGSPGGLAQALGSGLKDFISMPFHGLLQGPWGFIVGITHGSASLVKHITAGTVNSVTKLASSVARNLDRLTLDNEHLQRQEEFRRMRPQGVAQGLYQGLTGLGMSILAAVAGLAHHPLQQVWAGETSTKGLVAGVGLGLVGVVTKPLSGAAELVALAGQGLLQGTGWNSLPSPRQRPVVQYSNGYGDTSLRYSWRFMPLLAKSQDDILHVANADFAMLHGPNRAVSLVLTRQALLIVNVGEDSVEKIYSLKDLISADHPSESTMFRLYCSTSSPPQHVRKTSPVEQLEVRMDQEMRARVAEFLRTSSTGIASISTNSDAQSDTHDSVSLSDCANSLTFYINSDSRSYLLSIFNVIKKQSQGNDFTVL